MRRANLDRSPTWLFVFVTLASPANADRGSIPLKDATVDIEEPGQKAIVAWCAGKEALLLATELRASRDTEVLEIMPLPSEPEMKKGDYEAFEEINRIFEERRRRFQLRGMAGKPTENGIEITQREKIGPHDLTAIRVKEVSGVLRWLHETIEKRGGDPRSVTESVEAIVGGYVDRGIVHFVFDFVTVRADGTSVAPMLYLFDAPSPYYPIQITGITGKSSKIQLALLTTRHPNEWPAHCYSFRQMDWDHRGGTPITLSECEKISPEIAKLFRGQADPILLELLVRDGPIAPVGDIAQHPYARAVGLRPSAGGGLEFSIRYAGIRPSHAVKLGLGDKPTAFDRYLQGTGRIVPDEEIPVEKRFWYEESEVRLKVPAPEVRGPLNLEVFEGSKQLHAQTITLYALKAWRRFSDSTSLDLAAFLRGPRDPTLARARLGRTEASFVLDARRGDEVAILVAYEMPLWGDVHVDPPDESSLERRVGTPTIEYVPPGGPGSNWRTSAFRFVVARPGEHEIPVLFVTPGGAYYWERIIVRVPGAKADNRSEGPRKPGS